MNLSGKSAAILAALLFEIVALVLVVPRTGRMLPHSGKAIFTGGAVAALAYGLLLVALYLGLRDRPTTRFLGALLIALALLWIGGGLAAILGNTESMFLGLVSLAGVFGWLPLLLVGVALIAPVRKP